MYNSFLSLGPLKGSLKDSMPEYDHRSEYLVQRAKYIKPFKITTHNTYTFADKVNQCSINVLCVGIKLVFGLKAAFTIRCVERAYIKHCFELLLFAYLI